MTQIEKSDVPKAVVTCALTGVLTNPADYPAPVTPEGLCHVVELTTR